MLLGQDMSNFNPLGDDDIMDIGLSWDSQKSNQSRLEIELREYAGWFRG